MTLKPVSTESAEHYRWGEACDGWQLLAREDLSVIEERMPPGTAEQRQVEGARLALQHNLGLGGACVVTLYERV